MAKYVESLCEQETRERNFVYHAPINDQAERYTQLRTAAGELSRLLNESCPASRELAVAQTNLETAIFWENASIARNE